jgi:hypothetical protein
MTGLGDDESRPPVQLTRRERRLARSRARRTAALVGWLGYGISVLVVVSAAAWLAVRGGHVEAPERVAHVTVVQPVISLPDFATTTTAGRVAPAAPVVDLSVPTSTTSTTTAPVLSAAAIPAPAAPTP